MTHIGSGRWFLGGLRLEALANVVRGNEALEKGAADWSSKSASETERLESLGTLGTRIPHPQTLRVNKSLLLGTKKPYTRGPREDSSTSKIVHTASIDTRRHFLAAAEFN